MKVLYYIYYKIYTMHSKGETDSIASGLAVMTISAILFFNIFTIGALLKKIDVISRFISKPNDGISLMVFLLIINYFIFKHKKKYIKIKEMFAYESKKKSIIGGVYVILYGLLSFILLILIGKYRPGYI